MLIKKFQEGGAMPQNAPAEVPANAEGGQDPIMQIADIFAQALQNSDCNMLAQGAQMFLQVVSEAMGQGGPQGPVDQVPEGEPVFKKGGKLISRKKCAKKQEGGEIYGRLKDNQKDKKQTFGNDAFSNIKGKKVKIKL